MKSTLKKLAVFVMMTILLSTSVFAQQGVQFQSGYDQRPLRYSQISYESIRRIPNLARWYQRNYKEEGIHYRKYRGDMYVIVSAGKKPTGGYTLLIRNIRRRGRDTAFVRARLIPPAPNMIVTQVITYPHLLIKIEDRRITRVDGVINERTRGQEDKDSDTQQN
ncbi:MAG TPA: protease complex subunit PrcB family protein [Clostridia bacterium]|nr:protease complex subunit PrcB family protein [Clostridia bacterium]